MPPLANLRLTLLAAMGLSACAQPADNKTTDADLTDEVGPGTGGTTDTQDSGHTSGPCSDGEPILDDEGAYSGYQRCTDGAINRTDTHTWSTGGACVTDADCGDGNVCIDGSIGDPSLGGTMCITASCETSSDCDSGECGLSSYDDGCGITLTLNCRTPEDSCHADSECTGSTNQCVYPYWSEGAWTCAGIDCAIGRPLLAGDQSIVAEVEVRGSTDGVHRDPNAIIDQDPRLRTELAVLWARIAQAEHASVASFARATLELMAIGAPPTLLLDTQHASADEVKHAQLAFALASRFAGVALAPAPLPLDAVRPRVGAAAIISALLREACIGETVGVAEARLAAAQCTDPGIRAALTVIVEDETRHAALAWRTLRWMLDTFPALHEVAEIAAQDGIRALLQSDLPALTHCPAVGLLSADVRRELREATIRDVILPCLSAVLSSHAPLSANATRNATESYAFH